jgi:hypothetical protein
VTVVRRWLVPADLIPLGAFLVGFLAFPVRVLGGFSNIPGNLGDSRLNGYFLENIYQFLIGGSPSLWNLGMFAPYPYILGFSDNLFGAFPAYLLPRILTGDPSLSMVVWWYIGWIANFVAAYLALRKLSLERIGATVGAMVFTFALPLANYTFNWVQLDYRFGLPLAIAAWVVFLQRKSWAQLVVAAGWTVWQFYCTIYVGVFTLTLLLCITAAYLVVALFTSGLKGLVTGFNQYRSSLVRLGGRRIVGLSGALVSLAAAMVALMWPYLQVTRIYGSVRAYSEVFAMLPTVRSYLLSDDSWFWSAMSAQVVVPLMRWEHQLFPGAAVIALGLVGILAGVRRKTERVFAIMLLGLAAVGVLTFSFHGHSLWQFMSQLPLFSAIRAVARIIVAMLFLFGYLAGYGADALFSKGKTIGRVALALLAVALVVEFACVTPGITPRAKWQAYDAAINARIPKNLPPDAILFIAQTDNVWYESEVNAIWGALQARRQTINGYSGNLPTGFDPFFGTACSELPHRVLTYLSFSGKSGDVDAYRALMARMVPVGFTDCDPTWWTDPPATTKSRTDLSTAQLAAVTLTKGSASTSTGVPHGMVTVTNTMSTTLPADGTHPLRIGWRYVDATGTPLTGYDGRATLPFDLKPGASVDVFLSLDPSLAVKGRSIQVTLIQEGLMRATDVGVQPLSIKIND